jgi:probable F420-dependent oxidoreductase
VPVKLPRIGLFSPELRLADDNAVRDAVAELEQLGFGAVWCPGGPDGGNVIDAMRLVLDATSTMVAAAAVVNLHVMPAAQLAATFNNVDAAHPGRFFLGLGVSHAEYVEGRGESYDHPVERLASYLDDLDAIPVDQRFIGAQSPRMLALAKERTAGAFPYIATVERTAEIRALLGADPLLIAELPVILETDPDVARDAGRRYIARYTTRRNYTSSMAAQGFGPETLEQGGTDELIDAFVSWGDVGDVGARVQQYFDAGADHVALQVFNEAMTEVPMPAFTRLAELL